MRLLVTGWAGYLGPHVVRLLKEHGHYVIGLDTGWFLANYAEPPVYPDEAIFADIRDGITLNFPVQAVVHLAGLSNDPLGEIDPLLTRNINCGGTLEIADTLHDIRHVVASSCSVYGTADMATEETEPTPLTAYARAKDRVDRNVTFPYYNAANLRFGTLYGYSPGHRLDLVVNHMVYDATRGRGITVNGNAARPLTHVEDAARAIVQAVESPLMRGIYNVGGENYRMQELGRVVRDAVGEDYGYPPGLVFAHGGADQRDYSVSSEKLLATGFRFEHTVASSLPELVVKTASLPGLASRYVRLNTIQALIKSGYLDPSLRPAQVKVA